MEKMIKFFSRLLKKVREGLGTRLATRHTCVCHTRALYSITSCLCMITLKLRIGTFYNLHFFSLIDILIVKLRRGQVH